MRDGVIEDMQRRFRHDRAGADLQENGDRGRGPLNRPQSLACVKKFMTEAISKGLMRKVYDDNGLKDRLIADGTLRRFVNVYLNDEDVRFLGGLETPVKDGDTVTVLPAVAGGAVAGGAA